MVYGGGVWWGAVGQTRSRVASAIRASVLVTTTVLTAVPSKWVRAEVCSPIAALAPELPTMAEAGVPGYEMIGWNGVFVASGTEPAIVQRLASELAAVIAMPEVNAQLLKLGAEPVGSTPAAFAEFFKAEAARWGKIIGARHQAGLIAHTTS